MGCKHDNCSFEKKTFSNGTIHLEKKCHICGFKTYVPQNNPIDKMPFGKYKGVKIDDVPMDYLVWCSNNLNSSFGRKISDYLKSLQGNFK